MTPFNQYYGLVVQIFLRLFLAEDYIIFLLKFTDNTILCKHITVNLRR